MSKDLRKLCKEWDYFYTANKDTGIITTVDKNYVLVKVSDPFWFWWSYTRSYNSDNFLASCELIPNKRVTLECKKEVILSIGMRTIVWQFYVFILPKTYADTIDQKIFKVRSIEDI